MKCLISDQNSYKLKQGKIFLVVGDKLKSPNAISITN